MTRLSELDFYQSPWLHVNDLKGKPIRVTITRWALEEVNERDRGKVKKVALSFKSAKKRLLLNVSQGRAAEDAWGDLDNWIGKQCILQPGTASNSKPTINLVPLIEQSAPDAPREQQAPAEGEAGAEQPPASAEREQQTPAATGERMSDAEAAALWEKHKPPAEPYPGYSG